MKKSTPSSGRSKKISNARKYPASKPQKDSVIIISAIHAVDLYEGRSVPYTRVSMIGNSISPTLDPKWIEGIPNNIKLALAQGDYVAIETLAIAYMDERVALSEGEPFQKLVPRLRKIAKLSLALNNAIDDGDMNATWRRLEGAADGIYDRDNVYPILTALAHRAVKASKAVEEEARAAGREADAPWRNFVIGIADLIRGKGLRATASKRGGPAKQGDSENPGRMGWTAVAPRFRRGLGLIRGEGNRR